MSVSDFCMHVPHSFRNVTDHAHSIPMRVSCLTFTAAASLLPDVPASDDAEASYVLYAPATASDDECKYVLSTRANVGVLIVCFSGEGIFHSDLRAFVFECG